MSTLSDVTILVTSFLRFGYLEKCGEGIARNLPECSTIIVDDSMLEGTYLVEGDEEGSGCRIQLPFDSGLSAKRNAGVRECHTKYLLLACDDFDFSTKEAREGIERMVNVLDCCNYIDIAGGRVDHRPYEAMLEYKPGEFIKETRAATERWPGPSVAELCDLTVNYFLGRAEVMKQFPWPEEMKIGGEHVAFFLDLKLAGRKVCWVRGANITTQPYDPSKQDPRYPEFRARAKSLGHELMKRRYNIKQYIGMAGDIS